MIEIEQRLERSAEQIRTATTRVAVPARLSHPGERSPRRNGLLAVAAVAAVTVGGLVVVVQTTDTESPPATQPPATPPVDREEGSGSWQQMAAAPIRSRIGAASRLDRKRMGGVGWARRRAPGRRNRVLVR